MNIFLCEYCTSGLAGSGLPESLLREGRAMLAALAADLTGFSGVLDNVLLAEDVHLFGDDWPRTAYQVAPVPGATALDVVQECAADDDFTLLIAPEFDDILGSLSERVERAGGSLLGSSSAAVRITADKYGLGQRLAQSGVPTPPCALVEEGQAPDLPFRFPAVLKPRDGAGSQATFRVADAAELAAALSRARAEGWRGEMIVQPLVPGPAASIAFLVGPTQVLPLAAAEQLLSDDGRFRYLGGRLPLPEQLQRRAQVLGERAVRSVPGLRGYVGVDLVLGGAADGSADAVIEINPRFTTSYVGQRVLAKQNLAQALLAVVRGVPVSGLSWHPGPVRFTADGTVLSAAGRR